MKQRSLAAEIRQGLEESIRHAEGKISLKTTIVTLPAQPPAFRPDLLAELRERHQISRAVLARLLNVTARTVAGWERGTQKPSRAALRLIQVFQQIPDSLFHLEAMTPATSKIHETDS